MVKEGSPYKDRSDFKSSLSTQAHTLEFLLSPGRAKERSNVITRQIDPYLRMGDNAWNAGQFWVVEILDKLAYYAGLDAQIKFDRPQTEYKDL